jgi:hypothetical protein
MAADRAGACTSGRRNTPGGGRLACPNFSGSWYTASTASKKNKPITGKPLREVPQTIYPDLIEPYTPERIAEFILNNAVTADDYATALEGSARISP